MLDALPDLVNANEALVRRGRWTRATMLIGIGEQHWLVRIEQGRISVETETLAVSDWNFAIRGPEEAWRKFWAKMPPPMHHDLHALVRAGKDWDSKRRSGDSVSPCSRSPSGSRTASPAVRGRFEPAEGRQALVSSTTPSF